MRKTLCILIAVIALAACRKGKSLDVTGTLTGNDGRKCACCGGAYLTIDSRNGQFRTLRLPSMTQPELNALNYPVRIKFEYRNAGTCGADNLIEITDYELLP
jgi:hypothetical protein